MRGKRRESGVGMNVYAIENDITSCKTAKQVYGLLKKHKIKIHLDNTQSRLEYRGSVSKSKFIDVYLDEQTRIYYRSSHQSYAVQHWNRYKNEVMGKKRVPMCAFDDGKVHCTTIDDVKSTLVEYKGKHKKLCG